MADLATQPPTTLIQWIVLGVSMGAGAVFGALVRAMGLGARVARLEQEVTEGRVAKEDLAKLRAEAATILSRSSLGEDDVRRLLGEVLATHRSVVPPEIGVIDTRISTLEQELLRLRDAAERGANNHLATTTLLHEIKGALRSIT